jgi:hypothetical protein
MATLVFGTEPVENGFSVPPHILRASLARSSQQISGMVFLLLEPVHTVGYGMV